MSRWEVDPWNDTEIMNKVVGKVLPNPYETEEQARIIFYGQNGPRCLEIGAGYGRLLPEARKYFTECYGIDSSASIVARSTRYLLDDFNCKVVLSDGYQIPFPNSHFYFVYSFTCFQHMPDLETIQQNLREAFRVLKRGGKCRIQTVLGNRDEAGRYDGYVFSDPQEFADELRSVGFPEVTATVVDEWIWVTGEKP